MHIAFGVVGDVVIEHVADAIHVQPARGHVGGHQHVKLAVLQTLNGALTGFLLHITIDGGGAEAARGEFFGQLVGAQLGAGEDDHGIERLGLHDPGQRVQLVDAAHHPEPLADIFGGGRLRFDRDFGRIFQIRLRDAPDLVGHGGREQRHLPCFRGLFQHRFNVVDESHPQHFVGLIQHQHA